MHTSNWSNTLDWLALATLLISLRCFMCVAAAASPAVDEYYTMYTYVVVMLSNLNTTGIRTVSRQYKPLISLFRRQSACAHRGPYQPHPIPMLEKITRYIQIRTLKCIKDIRLCTQYFSIELVRLINFKRTQ